jgi:hypothetical protein
MDYGPRTTDYGPRTADYGQCLQTVESGSTEKEDHGAHDLR